MLKGFSRPEDRQRIETEERIQADQRARWQSGERVLVEFYLATLPPEQVSPETILDLVYAEVMLREELGEQPQLAEYQRRFPQHAEALARQFAVHEALEGDALVSSSDSRVKPLAQATFSSPLPGISERSVRLKSEPEREATQRLAEKPRRRPVLATVATLAVVAGGAAGITALILHRGDGQPTSNGSGPSGSAEQSDLEPLRREIEKWQRKAEEAWDAGNAAAAQVRNVEERVAAAKVEARQERYFSQLAQAENALRSDDPARAKSLLESCPEEQRGWEWYYLKRLCLVRGPLQQSPFTSMTAKTWRAGAETSAAIVCEGHTDSVEALAFCPLRKMLVSASHDQSVRLWDWTTGNEIHPPLPHQHPLAAVAVSPDGHWLVVGGGTQTESELVLWNLDRGNDHRPRITGPRRLLGHKSRIHAVAFRPNGAQLASAGMDGTIRVWEPQSGRMIHELKADAGAVHAIAYRPDSRQLASVGAEGIVKIWAADSGNLLGLVSTLCDRVTSLAYSSDGARLLAAGDDGVVHLSLKAGEPPQATLASRPSPPTAVVFNTDASRLVTASADGVIRLSESADGREILGLLGHRGPVNAIAFSPNGICLASAGRDHRIRLWLAPR